MEEVRENPCAFEFQCTCLPDSSLSTYICVEFCRIIEH